MDRVFVVVGSAGEYSDARQWNVRAFASIVEANAFVRLCDMAAASRPRRPNLWRRVGTGASSRAVRVDNWEAINAAHQEALLAWAATCPDPAAPERDPVDYGVEEVPFGAGSAALGTAPVVLRHRGRRLDLEPEEA